MFILDHCIYSRKNIESLNKHLSLILSSLIELNTFHTLIPIQSNFFKLTLEFYYELLNISEVNQFLTFSDQSIVYQIELIIPYIRRKPKSF